MKARTLNRLVATFRWLTNLLAVAAGLCLAQFILTGWDMLWLWIMFGIVILAAVSVALEAKFAARRRAGW